MTDSYSAAPSVLSVRRIWSEAPHQGMTDLIRFNNRWFCTFREGEKHVKGKPGTIRILTSETAEEWHSVALLSIEEIDLRDPKFTITPDNRLMLLIGAIAYTPDGIYATLPPRVAFSSDGFNWSPLHLILEPHEWLWRLTWHQNKAYGFSYRYSNPQKRKEEWLLTLFETSDGLSYKALTRLEIPGYPSEGTIRFAENEEMIALVRRGKRGDCGTWIGSSFPPYTSWDWKKTSVNVGGPNFLILSKDEMWACGRALFPTSYAVLEKTGIYRMTRDSLQLVRLLPSGGDTSYPGMVLEGGYLLISYYSSHVEDKASIYIAKVDLHY